MIKLSKRIILSIACTFLIAIVVIACRPTTPQNSSRLVVPSISNPQTFNYPLNNSAYSIFGYIYDGLLTENGITGKLEPALAESWQVSPDGKKITMTLRENLKWSDGQPLTTDDIVFTYDHIYLNPNIPTSFKDILRVGISRQFPQVKKISDRTVEFSVVEPFAPFIRFAGGLPILPKHALKETLEQKDDRGDLKFLSTWGTNTPPEKIVGNGEYTIATYTPGQRVILERNPYYWRKDTQGNAQPYIKQIVWQVIENQDTQLLSFRSGALDAFDVSPEAFPLLKKEEKRGGYKIYNGGPDQGTIFMAFNMNKARNAAGKHLVDPIKSQWFNNKLFRQAIAYAINRDAMTNNIYRGLGEPLNSPIPVQSPFYLSPEDGLKVYNYNPEKAQQLLQASGFKKDNQNNLIDANGNKVRFTLLMAAGRKQREQMATQIKQDLQKLGIQVDPQFLSFNSYVDKLNSREWDTYLGGFTGGGVEPHGGYNVWSINGRLHQFNLGPQPDENPPIQGWQATDWEKRIDQLYVQASQELNEDKRKKLYGETQALASENVPFIYMVNPLQFEAVRNRIKNVKYTALGGGFWNLYELQIKD